MGILHQRGNIYNELLGAYGHVKFREEQKQKHLSENMQVVCWVKEAAQLVLMINGKNCVLSDSKIVLSKRSPVKKTLELLVHTTV